MIVLGIDGGGTQTRCVAADRSGRVLGEGKAGPSNYQVVGLESAVAAVMAAVEEALTAAGASLADVEAVCAGLAGVGRPEDEAAMRAALPFAPDVKLQVVSDARIALEGALEGKPGAVLIAGTGSIAYGVDKAGQTVRAGGWGWVLGDEGSGFDIGRRALATALSARDAGGPTGLLELRICAAWRLERLDEAVRRVYADVTSARMEIAGLVPVVVEAAEDGDASAQAILTWAGHDLARLARTVLRRLALPGEPPVALTGGILSNCNFVRDALKQSLRSEAPQARLIAPIGTAVDGAVRMALNSL